MTLRRSLSILALSTLMAACMPSTPYYLRDYKVNTPTTVTVGSVMMAWEVGMRDGRLKTSSLRKELSYSGINGNVVYIAYRQLSGGLVQYAQPAFYQNLTYDLTKDRRITFQDVIVEILSADQAQISFTVLQEPAALIGQSGPTWKSNPCEDSLFVSLQSRLGTYFTKEEQAYYRAKEKECEEFESYIQMRR